MYKMKLWDEDKWNIHSSTYNSSKYANTGLDDKKDDKKYHEQKYGSKEKNVGSDYLRKQDEKEKEDKEKNPTLFDELEEEKNEKEEVKEAEIPFKAAKQVFDETRENQRNASELVANSLTTTRFSGPRKFNEFSPEKYETKKTEVKKDLKTIEDAIKKAIEEEKNVIVMDN